MARSDKRKHVVCAGCVVYRRIDDRMYMLLIRPRENSEEWGIPKGHSDEGESLTDCAIRETYEETGITCEPMFPLQPVETMNRREHKRLYAFIATCPPDAVPNPVFKHEVFDIAWFDVTMLPRVHPYQVPLVNQAAVILTSMLADS